MARLPMRQGDVLLRPVEEIPFRRRKVKTGESRRIILAYGEQTGHSHEVNAKPNEARLRQGEVDGQEKTFLEVLAPSVRLAHDEHGDIEVPEGKYEVILQREFTNERPRRVWD